MINKSAVSVRNFVITDHVGEIDQSIKFVIATAIHAKRMNPCRFPKMRDLVLSEICPTNGSVDASQIVPNPTAIPINTPGIPNTAVPKNIRKLPIVWPTLPYPKAPSPYKSFVRLAIF